MEKILEKLKTLKKSCEEGYDGTWDCSTDEGKDGFLDMITVLEEIEIEIEKEIKANL